MSKEIITILSAFEAMDRIGEVLSGYACRAETAEREVGYLKEHSAELAQKIKNLEGKLDRAEHGLSVTHKENAELTGCNMELHKQNMQLQDQLRHAQVNNNLCGETDMPECSSEEMCVGSE
ncbi:MAG: hypothetical protein LBI42_06425 [Chitinispirillales bacterium]|jgi:septal ring factor EnvC (AmiA/AmiB activator)|nr:hypothetical protein [Chitinispirillales bacterium]